MQKRRYLLFSYRSFDSESSPGGYSTIYLGIPTYEDPLRYRVQLANGPLRSAWLWLLTNYSTIQYLRYLGTGTAVPRPQCILGRCENDEHLASTVPCCRGRGLALYHLFVPLGAA